MSSCSFIHYRLEMRKNQQKVYDRCVKEEKIKQDCHNYSINKIKDFDNMLHSLSK